MNYETKFQQLCGNKQIKFETVFYVYLQLNKYNKQFNYIMQTVMSEIDCNNSNIKQLAVFKINIILNTEFKSTDAVFTGFNTVK